MGRGNPFHPIPSIHDARAAPKISTHNGIHSVREVSFRVASVVLSRSMGRAGAGRPPSRRPCWRSGANRLTSWPGRLGGLVRDARLSGRAIGRGGVELALGAGSGVCVSKWRKTPGRVEGETSRLPSWPKGSRGRNGWRRRVRPRCLTKAHTNAKRSRFCRTFRAARRLRPR